MRYLAEDPWPVTILCAIVAGGCLIALRFTQQGKYLIGMIVAVALAAVVWTVDLVWVTDAERVERVVYDLARAVREVHPPATPDNPSAGPSPTADPAALDRVFTFLTPDVMLENDTRNIPSVLSRSVIRGALERTAFDFVNVSRLEVEVAPQARRAKARFRVHAGGSMDGGTARYNFLTDAQGTDWDLGLRETDPGTWKVTRITSIRMPLQARVPGF